jgi:hypothetical protein
VAPTVAPTLSEYYNAANAVEMDNRNGTPATTSKIPASAGLTPFLESNSDPLSPGNNWLSDGFFGEAFIDKNGDVIVAFEGSLLIGGGAFGAGSRGADRQILIGGTPAAFNDANLFVTDVEQYVAKNYSALDPIYLTGHSLGGAEAEYVASLGGESGVTFGAPGEQLPNYSQISGQTFTDYVDFGDPVGNFVSFGKHFGTVQEVGPRLDQLGGELVGLALFHPLSHYGADLAHLGLLAMDKNGWAAPTTA